jgi:hypothetical protein
MGISEIEQLTAYMRAIAAAVPLGTIASKSDYTTAMGRKR